MAKASPLARIRAQALKEIAEKNGGKLVPEKVVETARDPNNPLHDAFEWNDTVAGALYRLEQAAQLIREIKVVLTINSVRVSVPVYVSDPDPFKAERSYVALDRVAQREEDAERVLNDEFSRIEGAIKRGKAVAAVLGLDEELDLLMTALLGIRERARSRPRPSASDEDRPSA